MDEKWRAVLEALELAILELDGKWPVPLEQRPARKRTPVRGYSRGKGQRPVLPLEHA
jgi:hypothetical protein